MKTGIVKDARYMEHDMGSFHVENPKRLEVIYDMIEKDISFPLENIPPRPARAEEVAWVHSPAYIGWIKETSGKERVILDPDTSTSAGSFNAAMLAVGGLLEACQAVMTGKIQNGFALVRPPGHHAETSRAMGFCLFNNAAVAAEFLLKKQGLKRVLIVDWDLHHGNGTQNFFYSREDVLYFSTHQFPHYPGTGHWSETGSGSGEGYTVNVPLYAGKGDSDYRTIFKSVLSPVVDQFKPEFIIVSAGFDISEADPLGGMNVSALGFGALARDLMAMAEKHCAKRILFTLEGGYDLGSLRDGVKEVLLQLSENTGSPDIAAKNSPSLDRELHPVFEIQRKFWKL